jgi:hypothetical protein
VQVENAGFMMNCFGRVAYAAFVKARLAAQCPRRIIVATTSVFLDK